jgi:hypothetical protein
MFNVVRSVASPQNCCDWPNGMLGAESSLRCRFGGALSGGSGGGGSLEPVAVEARCVVGVLAGEAVKGLGSWSVLRGSELPERSR